MLKFHVPSGIGDISWCYSKVADMAKRRPVAFYICGDNPKRSHPYVNLLPGIVNLGYTKLSYAPHILPNILPRETNLESLSPGTYYLALNSWLEAGNPLHAAFPKQRTDYHYQMHLPIKGSIPIAHTLSQTPRKRIGFYCSSNRHRQDLGMWNVDQWVRFLKLVRGIYPDCVFVALGAPYDEKTDQVADVLSKDFQTYRCLNQPPGHSFRILEEFSYFFAFPSGLGIMADILRVPCMMWFWGNLPGFEYMKGLFGSYADPESVASGFHITAPYASVEDSFKLFQERGLRHVR